MKSFVALFVLFNIFYNIWAIAVPDGEFLMKLNTESDAEFLIQNLDDGVESSTAVASDSSLSASCDNQLIIYENLIAELQEKLDLYNADR